MPRDGLLSVRETARRLGVHENTIRNWADSGILPVAKRLPKSGYRRFAPADVEFLRRNPDRAPKEIIVDEENGPIHPGMMVMVLVGEISSKINNHPPLVCLAEIVEPMDDHTWWLDVFTGTVQPLRQMYQTQEILGIPCPGLRYLPFV